MRLYRVTPKKYAADTSGEGAKRKGGRWNPPGFPIHYTSLTASMSALELLVHVDPEDLPPLALITYEIPDDMVCNYDGELPADWELSSSSKKLAEIGKAWLEGQSSLALRVPTILFPNGVESNVLVNPLHPDFRALRTVQIEDFEFDPKIV